MHSLVLRCDPGSRQAAVKVEVEVMYKRLRPLVLVLALVVFSFPRHSNACSCCVQASLSEPTTVNTVVLANQVDVRFSRDFSVLLKQLRLQWVIVDSATVPDAVKDRNVILLGRLDAVYTGEIMRGLMTAEDIEMVRATADRHTVLEKASPWTEGRSVYICTGADLVLTRNAAEEAVRTIIASSPPSFAWLQTRFDAALDEDAREYVDQLRFAWDDAELPLADMTMDVGAKPRWRISTQQAMEDVERLFYLFAHGYSGYAFFSQNEWEQARSRILEELVSRPGWSSGDFSRLLYDQLGFITDCHLKIGEYSYAGHLDFWYDTSLALTLSTEGYQLTADGVQYAVVSINNQDPEPFVFPSLNSQGEPIYRLGLLSKAEPASLLLVAVSAGRERRFEIKLQRSDYTYYSKDLFREDNVGGIPVVRVRTFSDHHASALDRFVETASAHRGEPVIIVDNRGNGGGNEAWPIRWIQGLTGQRAESVFIFSELNSKTTMAGRANLFAYLHDLYPGTHSYREEAERFANVAEAFESGARQPNWTGPYYPQMPLIANDTTVVIAMNGGVASAGEGLVMRASRAENVVLVGENTMGCLTFGNAGVHQLPHSRLMVHLPINFGLYLDMEFREGKGLTPDLWVPAADAVNYAVAAVRSGTITTYQPLSPTTLQQAFVPEDPWARVRQERLVRFLVVALVVAAGSVWAYFMRKKPRFVIVAGIVWLTVGTIGLLRKQPVGLGFLFLGAVCLVWGGTALLRTRRISTEVVS